MATMGKYCKAYSLKKLREFSQWTECAENTLNYVKVRCIADIDLASLEGKEHLEAVES